jgi:hypothetical protein
MAIKLPFVHLRIRSRISPTKITFGAWRNAARSPAREIYKILSELPLVESSPFVRMQEFDRILEGDNVNLLH